HPLGEAIVSAAQERKLTLDRPERFTALAGQGIEAEVSARRVLLGNPGLLRQRGLTVDDEAMQRLTAEGQTPVLVVLDDRLAGVLAIADRPRPGAREAVERLKRLGLQVVLLTGDNARTASVVARQMGIDRVHAEVLPEGKGAAIKSLQEQGQIV